jgi:hypothetical protein
VGTTASVLLCALLLAACGSGDSSSSPSAASTEEAKTTTESTASKRSENAEESIEGFGSEATGSPRAQLIGAFRAYLGALGEADIASICAGLAARVRESLANLAQSKEKKASCESVLPKLLSPSAPTAARQQANGKVTRVRVKGDEAFIIFHAPGARLYQMTMVRESGRWKASTAIASVLAPASTP